MQRGHRDLGGRREQQRWRCRRRQGQPAVAAGQPARAGPDHLACRGQLVQHGRLVAGHPARQHQGLQRRGRQRRPGQLLDHVVDGVRAGPPGGPHRAAGPGGRRVPGVLPGGQERGQRLRRHRLGFLAQLGQAAAAQHAQHAGVAPLGAAAARQELALGDPARTAASRCSAPVTTATPSPYRSATACAVNGPCVRGVPRHQVAQRVGDRLGERGGTPGGSGDAERVPQPARVLRPRPSGPRPPTRTSITRRCVGQPGQPAPGGRPGPCTAPATSAADSGPISRSRSATPSASRQARSGASRCSSASVSATTSGSSSSRRSAWPSSSASSEESSASACARRSASGESPSYMNAPT